VVQKHAPCASVASPVGGEPGEDLKQFDVPTLVLHGADDQIVPIAASGLMSAKIVKGATLKVYKGFPHGVPTTNADQIDADLLAFIRQSRKAAA
jgi:non-heme chloroperoxidase